jgi:hypothetical protein
MSQFENATTTVATNQGRHSGNSWAQNSCDTNIEGIRESHTFEFPSRLTCKVCKTMFTVPEDCLIYFALEFALDTNTFTSNVLFTLINNIILIFLCAQFNIFFCSSGKKYP